MSKFNYERTYKAADTAYYRLAKLEPMFGMPEADSINPRLLENESANKGLKSLMSNTSKKTAETQESIGELTLLFNQVRSQNEELKSNIISGES
jgi:hypothetical protein